MRASNICLVISNYKPVTLEKIKNYINMNYYNIVFWRVDNWKKKATQRAGNTIGTTRPVAGAARLFYLENIKRYYPRLKNKSIKRARRIRHGEFHSIFPNIFAYAYKYT